MTAAQDVRPHYCGCCGQVEVGDDFWCAPCLEHVPEGGLVWEQTYYAQHGVPCPFQMAMGVHDGCGCKFDTERAS